MAFESRLKVLIGGDDNGAKRAFESIRNDAKKTANDVKKASEEGSKGGIFSGGLGAAVGGIAAGAGAAAAIVGDLVLTSQKYDDALLRLQTSMHAAGLSYQANAADIQKVIDANIKYGTKEDDTLALLNQGVVATGSYTKAVALLTEAQNIHAGSTLDLSTAYMAALKGSEGNLRALKQMGIDAPIAAGGALKTAKALEAVAAAQEGVTKAQEKQNAQDQNVTLKLQTQIAQAKQHLLFLEEQTRTGKKLTLSQEQAIAVAQEKVRQLELQAGAAGVTGANSVAAAVDKLAKAKANFETVSQTGASVTAYLNKKFAGQAEAQSHTLLTREQAATAELDKYKRIIGADITTFFVKTVIPDIHKANLALQGFGQNIYDDVISPFEKANKAFDSFLENLAAHAGVKKSTTKKIADSIFQNLSPATQLANMLGSGAHDDTATIEKTRDDLLHIKEGTTAAAIAGDKVAQATVRTAFHQQQVETLLRQAAIDRANQVKWLEAIAQNIANMTTYSPAGLAAANARNNKRNGTPSPLPFFGSYPP